MNLASKNQLYFYTGVIYLNVKKNHTRCGYGFQCFLLVCAPAIAHTRHHLRGARLQCNPYHLLERSRSHRTPVLHVQI